ncbi:hypothetical protein AGABI1DRAFT_122508 [Agaricus bisporus var. burnettii JB137-S8]|uniref:SUI1 domain-containing protein n=1 Tax=Agaricus bisporus var. burnettii (strain JB137-S8 / ATCC MYA-4627 / FGSC 10392) TaxID=597362 RepID=K5X0E5_AGABU|nr:uncharacterized protein AGABI1DRAFT_122508 [Agaricus bisporus var. burnettii JB137-S8]EKM76563.1 hypothetical protein AGABI1DRAFT_122508 [Agaricus bisporus var. burnettii JB137-S8]
MFKKPLGQLKTSAPIRASDRRKLKQRVLSAFSASLEHGDLLVPDGILTAKFFTHTKQPGTLYIDPGNGDPLWFTIGKSSEDLIPTVYTLWKLRDSNLLPSVLTPSAVIPILVGGADLMIPGVITHTPSTLSRDQLVAIHQLASTKNDDGTVTRLVSPPLAVGRMAISGEDLKTKSEADEKGKAVLVLHTWKDHLWDMGQKGDTPNDTPLVTGGQVAEGGGAVSEGAGPQGGENDDPTKSQAHGEPVEERVETPGSTAKVVYTPQEITDLLTKSLIHAIATQLSTLPKDSYPIPSTQLYQSYILPSRPAFPSSVVLPSSAPPDSENIHIDPSEIAVKASTYKTLSTFLKAAEKSSLITLKTVKQKSGGSDYVVTGVNCEHPDVNAYVIGQGGKPYVTVAEIEAKKAKRLAREGKEGKERERSEREVEIRQCWKPWLGSLGLFEDMGASTSNMYTLNDIRGLLTKYITSRQLINQHDQAYINLDGPLIGCITAKRAGEPGKKAEKKPGEDKSSLPEFMKRDELMRSIVEHMQAWHEVKAEGKDVVTTKGEIEPIQVKVTVGARRGRTEITGFEPFLIIDGEEMADRMRKICAGSTSRTNHQRLKVTVQGKQGQAVGEYLMERGIPKKWIMISEVVGKK